MFPAYIAVIPALLSLAWAAGGLRSPAARRPLVRPSMGAVAVIAAVVVGVVPGAGAASSAAAAGHEVVTVDVGWAPSSNIPWNDLTQIDLFNLATTAGPNLDKSNIANVNVPQWVAAAHAHGLKAKIQIGGEGNNNWGTACNDTNRAQFVQNLIGFATSNGFDAVDLDIEDGPWSAIGPPNPAMTTCIEAISNAAHAKGLFLSEDVITNWQGPWLAPSKDYVDQYQLMTFGDNLSQMQADVQQTINQGLPASKFIVGVDVADYAPPSGGCGQFATYAAQAGLKGTFVWTTRADSDNGNACANGLAASSGPPPPGPAVTLTPAGLTFASQTVGTTSSAQTSTLQNTGTAPLTISSIATGGTNATDFAQTNNCPTSPSTLAAGASCTISVTFTPGASGSRSGTVVITDNAPGSPHALTLSGTGAATPFNWAANASSDFDGDHITDLGGLYRGRTPLDSLWYAPASSANGAFQIYFGATTDVPVPGDYDGDGKTDAVIFRPSSGLWYGPRTGAAQIVIQMMLGQAGDIPVPGDYDGDGKTDPAIYRPSTGLFFAVLSAGGTLGTLWGGPAGDIPVPRDWDGDGKTDVAIYRPSTGQWSAKLSGGGTYQVINGAAGDVPVPADYNGDRRADPVVWRPSTGKWTGPYNGATGSYANTLGQTGDIPIPGYYDNNKKVDPAIWRPSTGLWFAALSGGGTKSMAGLGAAGDVPVQRRPALAG